jgi:FdhE protein
MPNLHPEGTVRTAPILSDEARSALADQVRRTPDWQPWLELLEVALGEADAPEWRSVDIQFATDRPVEAPLLEGARIGADAAAAARTLDALLEVAGARSPQRGDPSTLTDAFELMEAAVRQDAEGVATIAERSGAPGPLLATVAHFFTMPLLLEAGHRAAPATPRGWRAGYCPTCGGWPTLAEMRGLERRRVLRCGRCAAGWERELLHCAFCGERDHRQQGALVPEDEGELVRIETCESCRGYLKVFTTLRPKPVWSLLLEDLRSLPLELKALERGFSRPDRPGWMVACAVTPHPGEP